MDNLNEYGIAISSPLNRDSVQSGMLFDFQTDRGAIRTSKIRDFNFNSGQGGTLTLGGAGNGNGLMVVQDATGSTVVTINNGGITVNGGSITIYNTAGSSVIDSLGVNSLTNFSSGGTSVTGGSGQQITSSTYTDLTNSSLNIALTRSAKVLLIADVRARVRYSSSSTANISGDAFVNIVVGTTPEVNTEIFFHGEYDALNHDHYGEYLHSSYSTHSIKNLNAGTTTVKLQGRLVDTTNSLLEIYDYKFSYIVLGT